MMVKEYIERSAALERLKSSLSFTEKGFDDGLFKRGCIAAIKDDISNIRHLPTADVVEVRHGRWENAKAVVGINPATLDFEIGDADRCSLCGVDFEAVRPKYKYCPNCGAKMDGDGNG